MHCDIFRAIELPEAQLTVLYNEACFQRAQWLELFTLAQDPKMASEFISGMTKVHGHYTAGFYDRELDGLKEALGGGK